MNNMIRRMAPNAADMIRADHTHAMATFHQYDLDTGPTAKKALVSTLCLALEVHAQLEEEIFYPAMREVTPGDELVEKHEHDHAELHRLIARIRGMEASDPSYDSTLMELMRVVIHHVADEETKLLPQAEAKLSGERLSDLGAEMTKRRMQLLAPHATEIASNSMRSAPATYALMAAGALIAGGYVVKRAFGGRHDSV